MAGLGKSGVGRRKFSDGDCGGGTLDDDEGPGTFAEDGCSGGVTGLGPSTGVIVLAMVYGEKLSLASRNASMLTTSASGIHWTGNESEMRDLSKCGYGLGTSSLPPYPFPRLPPPLLPRIFVKEIAVCRKTMVQCGLPQDHIWWSPPSHPPSPAVRPHRILHFGVRGGARWGFVFVRRGRF